MRNSLDRPISSAVALIVMLAATAPAMARPGGWAGPGWGDSRWDEPLLPAPSRDRPSRASDSREGKVDVSRFVSEGTAADALGHGAITVTSRSSKLASPSQRAVFEAAVIDRLVHAGYDTTQAQPDGGQVAELRVTRTTLEPAETRRKPVSGQAAMAVGNRGTAYGLALNVDLSKPRPSLISTRLDARIRDRMTNAVLWEGRAEIATREGDDRSSQQDIAKRLADALFDGFPRATDNGRIPG